MKKTKTKYEIIEIIENKYLNCNSIEDMIDVDFIVDMYINGYNGISNYDDDDFIECVERELGVKVLKKLKDDKFIIEGEIDDDDDDHDIFA